MSKFESYMLANGEQGEKFYTEMKDNEITARAAYYNRKVSTRRVIVVDPDEGRVVKVIEVIIKD